MEGVPVLTCLQVREDTIQSVIPGAVHGECDKCAHKVWISVSGQKMIASEEVRVRCLECVRADMAPDVEVRIVPGAVEEIRALGEDLRP